jgi:hypothetical protein
MPHSRAPSTVRVDEKPDRELGLVSAAVRVVGSKFVPSLRVITTSSGRVTLLVPADAGMLIVMGRRTVRDGVETILAVWGTDT